jgi:hypothetical protein
MNHLLSLEIPDTLNLGIMKIVDFSTYDSRIPAECPVLDITVPGFLHPTRFSDSQLQTGFDINVTACDLGLQSENCASDNAPLPDGIYILRYSVSPNTVVYVEYNYLRIAQILNRYNNILCTVPLTDSEPNDEVMRKVKLLQLAKIYIEAAKVKVEIAHEPEKGMQLYTYAMKILTKFDCRNC